MVCPRIPHPFDLLFDSLGKSPRTGDDLGSSRGDEVGCPDGSVRGVSMVGRD